MIPPRPWSVSQPPWDPGLAYLVDAHGQAVIPSSLDPELALFLATLANDASEKK